MSSEQQYRRLVQMAPGRVELHDCWRMPNATAYLWNSSTLLQMNCLGYAIARTMQPEPLSYISGPALEQATFFQPEPQFYSHHPGRFFYLKDSLTQELLSIPAAPVNRPADDYLFTVQDHSLGWRIQDGDIVAELSVSLHADAPVEYWDITVSNIGSAERELELFPYFPIGYRSWMSQSAEYRADIFSIVAHAATPYQTAADFERVRDNPEWTFLRAEQPPMAWETRQSAFEGRTGLHAPAGVHEGLGNGCARYQTPAAVMQYRLSLQREESQRFRFMFGSAKHEQDIANLRWPSSADQAQHRRKPTLRIETPDEILNLFVNDWLLRQIQYHADLQRLTTDPQTRNFLQDSMGIAYLEPAAAQRCWKLALAQQHQNGSMPDGILLHAQAELKYINQVPHTDHTVWVPICLSQYLRASGDYGILDLQVPFADQTHAAPVSRHVELCFDYLLQQRDDQGLSLMGEGDWCDPMNRVGVAGHGVSSWLTLALAYACQQWAEIAELSGQAGLCRRLEAAADELNSAVNRYLWSDDRYARGRTDAGRLFGIGQDSQAALFLNPQSWAMLSGAADEDRCKDLWTLIESELGTVDGTSMLAPAYQQWEPDIGRITQKHPGTAENGSVYNHATAFYAYALFLRGAPDEGLQQLTTMIPQGDEDCERRGQLPVFVPNYYRGAHTIFPDEAGRSSQLIHTGTINWFLACLIGQLFGITATPAGLRVAPKLPSDWDHCQLEWQHRGALINLIIERRPIRTQLIICDGESLTREVLEPILPGQTYQLEVHIPDD